MPPIPGMPPEQPKKKVPAVAIAIIVVIVALLVAVAVGFAFCSKADSGNAPSSSSGSSIAGNVDSGDENSPIGVGSWQMMGVTIEDGTLTYDECVANGIEVIESFDFNADGTYSIDWPGMATLSNQKWTETDLFSESYPFGAELPALADEFMDGSSAYFIVDADDKNLSYLTISTGSGDMVMFILAKGETADQLKSETSGTPVSTDEKSTSGKNSASSASPSAEHSNALDEAHDYLNALSFSRTGLIEQLEYEGYPTDVATWAVDNCGADWNEEAVRKAEEYLSWSDMSRSELIDQLEFEGFTPEQAKHGVDVAYK